MKFKDFRKKMEKGVFSTAEAQVVCFADDRPTINLQLHLWKRSGELIGLKRGVYMFAEYHPSADEIAKNLYFPCYFSLEYALNYYNILPEVTFIYTLVTPKQTRLFKTPLGTFSYQTITNSAFTGFDSKTLMAEKEKALVDYFYYNSARLQPRDDFWEESRLEAVATNVNFKKVFEYAKLFHSKKLILLLDSFHAYAKSYQTHQ